MDDHDPKKADMAGLIANFEKLDNVSLIAEKYQEKLKASPAGLDAAGKERLMRGCIDENCMEGIKEICYRNMDVLMNLPDLEANKKEPNLDYRTMKRNLISIRAGLKDEKQMEVMEQVIRDGALAYELSNEKIMAAGDDTAVYNIRAELDQGNELTSRNVATSRIAELLGVGDCPLGKDEGQHKRYGENRMFYGVCKGAGSFLPKRGGLGPHRADRVYIQRLVS